MVESEEKAYTIDFFTDTAAILDSIVLANTLWDAQGANDPKLYSVESRQYIIFLFHSNHSVVLLTIYKCCVLLYNFVQIHWQL